MKDKNQNPYADVVVDRIPSFLIRYGIIVVILFLGICILVGYKIKIQTAPMETERSAIQISEDTASKGSETLSGYVFNTIMSLF